MSKKVFKWVIEAGAALRKERTFAGYSARALSEEIVISPSWLRKLEDGSTTPTYMRDFLDDLAEWGLPVDYKVTKEKIALLYYYISTRLLNYFF